MHQQFLQERSIFTQPIKPKDGVTAEFERLREKAMDEIDRMHDVFKSRDISKIAYSTGHIKMVAANLSAALGYLQLMQVGLGRRREKKIHDEIRRLDESLAVVGQSFLRFAKAHAWETQQAQALLDRLVSEVGECRVLAHDIDLQMERISQAIRA